jgi:hypothetical protein
LAAFFMGFEQRGWIQSSPALTGDAAGYYARAREAAPFYAAHIREPLFPAFIRLGFFLTNSADQVVARRVSGWASIGVVIAIGLLGLKVAGAWGGGIAPWLYAGTPLTAYYGVSGLRESSMGLLVILFVLLLLCDRSWPARLGAGAAPPPCHCFGWRDCSSFRS